MKSRALTLVILSSFFLISFSPAEASNKRTSAVEISSPKLEYPDNQSKAFSEVDEFYNQLDKAIYEEYENAAFSMREKISFKEAEDTKYIFNVKTKLGNEKTENPSTPHIHPNRQVYFFGSFHQNEKEEWHKYAVIDAETKNLLLGGNHYHKYENGYE
ncbi:hypothetical protein ACTHOQ_08015 [Solibacillus silvestris]|uniref:hypothetical protein n=1 Tax=Solibacillus silvestris TaxID=76853 RepID=UPI003F7F5B9E